jgi:hypothetical protein
MRRCFDSPASEIPTSAASSCVERGDWAISRSARSRVSRPQTLEEGVDVPRRDLVAGLAEGGAKVGLDPPPFTLERFLPVVGEQRKESLAELAGLVEQELRQGGVAAGDPNASPDVCAHDAAREHARLALSAVIPQWPKELERDELCRKAPKPRQLGLEVAPAVEGQHEVGRPVNPGEAERVEPSPQRSRQLARTPDPMVLGGVTPGAARTCRLSAASYAVVQRRSVVDDHRVRPRLERDDLVAARVVQRDVEAVVRADDRIEHRVVLLRTRRRRDPNASGADGHEQREPDHACDRSPAPHAAKLLRSIAN